MVILIIGILIAVAAPTFLGETQKAHESAAAQQMAVAYKDAKSFAVDNTVQNSFSGYTQADLNADEPELSGVVTVVTVSATSVTFSDFQGVTYTQSFSNTTGPGAISG